MTRIRKIGYEQNDLLRQPAPAARQQADRAAGGDASVVSQVKPEIGSAGEALQVAVKMLQAAKDSKTQAVSAQSGLDEARVKALLSED